MKKCVIVEDELAAIEVVRFLASQIEGLSVVGTFTSAQEALDFLNTRQDVDILFLDIHLPEMNGFTFLDALKPSPKVVLTTSDKNMALTAYDFDLVVDYLVKPLQKDRFMEAVSRC